MKLRLCGIEVDCVIGDLPEERTRLQRLRVDAELTVPDVASSSDDLADTVETRMFLPKKMLIKIL